MEKRVASSTVERPPGMQRFKRPPGLTAHHLPPLQPPQQPSQQQQQSRSAKAPTARRGSVDSLSGDDSAGASDREEDFGYDDDADDDFVRDLQQSCGYTDDQVRSLLAAYRVTRASANKGKGAAAHSSAPNTPKQPSNFGTTTAEAKGGVRVPMPLPPPSAAPVGDDAALEKSERRRMQEQLDDLLADIATKKSQYDDELAAARSVIAKARRDAAEKAAAREAERKARADAPVPVSLRLHDAHVAKYERDMATKAERERLRAEIKKFEEQEAARERRERGIVSNLAIRKRIEAEEKLAQENPLASGKHSRVLGPRIGRAASGPKERAPVVSDDMLLQLIATALPPPPVRKTFAAQDSNASKGESIEI